MHPTDVILSPVISEKSHDMIRHNKYTFRVARSATKTEIAKALKSLFNVDAQKVNVLNVHRKQRRMGRFAGATSAWKKAVVTLPKNQKIPGYFEGM
ncbi:MAG: 50S ribosomal protein L23 [bacterium]